jgi:uncharacterized protein (TIGR00369 family)
MLGKIGETSLFDAPENRCFGCSPHNPLGLRLRFTRTGLHSVESRYTAPEHLAGAPGVVHGGVQATLLDEVLGVAADTAFPEAAAPKLVTVDFQLRYRRPTPVGRPLCLRGRFLRCEGRDVFVEGEIADEAGEILTRAEARWRILPEP